MRAILLLVLLSLLSPFTTTSFLDDDTNKKGRIEEERNDRVIEGISDESSKNIKNDERILYHPRKKKYLADTSILKDDTIIEPRHTRRRRTNIFQRDSSSIQVVVEEAESLSFEQQTFLLGSELDTTTGPDSGLSDRTAVMGVAKSGDGDDTTEMWWDAAVLFEWKKIARLQKQENNNNNEKLMMKKESSSNVNVNGLSAFLICHKTDANSSALSSKREIIEAIQDVIVSESNDDMIHFYKHSLYINPGNSEETLMDGIDMCIYATMKSTTASSLLVSSLSDELIVQPMVSVVKIRTGGDVLEDIIDIEEDTLNNRNTTVSILVELSPGIVSSNEDAYDLAVELVDRITIDWIEISSSEEEEKETPGNRRTATSNNNNNYKTMYSKSHSGEFSSFVAPTGDTLLSSTTKTTTRKENTNFLDTIMNISRRQHHRRRRRMPIKNNDSSSISSKWNSVVQKAASKTSAGGCLEEFNGVYIKHIIPPSVSRNTFIIHYSFSNSLFTEEGEGTFTPQTTNSMLCHKSFVLGLSNQPETLSVGKQSQFELQNDIAQWIVQSNIPDERPWFDVDLTGTAQIVQVSDDGLDTNHCYFWDEAVAISSNLFFSFSSIFPEIRNERDGQVRQERRKVVQYIPWADDKARLHDHGTHVTGTLLGKNVAGEGMVDGVAHGAKVAFFDISKEEGVLDLPSDFRNDMIHPGQQAGAKIHSSSWNNRNNFYDETAEMVDDILYAQNENDDDTFLWVTSVGNYGRTDNLNSASSPAVAKNVISVGSVESYGKDLSVTMLSRDYISSLSSRGPTADGRIKPELLAPGDSILSAGAQPNMKPSKCYGGACDSYPRPDYVGFLSLSDIILRNTGLIFDSGTSQATPSVSGAAALVRQYFEEGWYPNGMRQSSPSSSSGGGGEHLNPSGALIKAVLINGAQPITGVNNGPIGGGVTPVEEYDNHGGFGRVNLIKSLPLRAKNYLMVNAVDRQSISQDESHYYEYFIKDPDNVCLPENPNLSVTLTWMDPPAVVGCNARCLLNDLDLDLSLTTSTYGSQETTRVYYPNGRHSRDSVNNVERIRVPVSSNDAIKIKVTANSLDTETQRYSLVVTGCINGTDYPPDNTAGHDIARCCGSGGSEDESSIEDEQNESFSVTMKKRFYEAIHQIALHLSSNDS